MKPVMKLSMLCLFALPVHFSHACMVDVALPVLVGQSDLIVVGTVTDDGRKGEQEVAVPKMKAPLKSYFHQSSFKIEKILRDTGGKAKVGSGIQVVAMAKKPQKPGGLMLHVADGPSYPNLTKGQQYLLLLSRLPGKKGYYLPAYPKNFASLKNSQPGRVEEYSKLCDLDAWPWGEASNGIQLAVIPSKSEITLMKSRTSRNGPFFWNAYTQIVYALRNVSDAPVAISHYPVDRFLDLKIKEGATESLYDSWSFLGRSKYQGFSEKFATVVQPGGLLFLAPYGVDHYGQSLSRKSEAGKAELQLEYSSKRTGTKDGVKLWQGRVVSGISGIEMKMP